MFSKRTNITNCFRYRLLPIILGIPLLPIGLFVYGWTAEYEVHWIVPIVFTGFSGAGLIFSFVRNDSFQYSLTNVL